MIRLIVVAILCLCAKYTQVEQRLPENEHDCFIVPHTVAGQKCVVDLLTGDEDLEIAEEAG